MRPRFLCHQFFAQCGRGCGWSLALFIFVISICSTDICDSESEVVWNCTKFLNAFSLGKFWSALQTLYLNYGMTYGKVSWYYSAYPKVIAANFWMSFVKIVEGMHFSLWLALARFCQSLARVKVLRAQHPLQVVIWFFTKSRLTSQTL